MQHKPAKPAARVVTRLVVDFVLRCIRAATRNFEGDLLGALVFLVLLQARHSRIPLRSGGAPAPNGGETQRPISVYSLAQSLKTPPETMRRCVGRLIARGWCVRADGKGVVIPDELPADARNVQLVREMHRAFWRMLADLKDIGFDFDLMDRASLSTDDVAVGLAVLPDAAPTEATARKLSDPAIERVIVDFVLRFIESGVAPHNNDYVRSCVFVAIMSANAAPFAYDPEKAWHYATHDTPPPDAARRAASLAEISQILGMPYETVRRYVNALIADGLCVRDERKGLTIPMSILQSPEALNVGFGVTMRFAQMIGDLKRLGIEFRMTDFAALAKAGEI